MPEFQVNPPAVCSICGEVKEAEELSDLDGQLACLDCIARANIAKNVPLEQLAAASQPNPTQQTPRRRGKLGMLIWIVFVLCLVALIIHFSRERQRKQMLRNSLTSLRTEGDNLVRSGKLEEGLSRYEALLKQLQNKPLSDLQIVALYHDTEKAAAAPYLSIVMPRLERAEALLLADRSEEARAQFRELANFINVHSVQPEQSVRERIDRVTDELRVPRIAKANWRREIPSVSVAARPLPGPMSQPIVVSEPNREPTSVPKPTVTDVNPAPTPQPSVIVTPTPKPPAPKPIEPISVPSAQSQGRALEQIRANFADKYAQSGPLARRALAHLLFITAQDSASDPVMRFALLRESRDLAVRVPEPRIALAAVDEMAASYIISDVSLRLSTLAECAQNALTAETNEVIAQSGLDLADRMAAEKHYDEAYRCAVIANSAAQKSRQPELIFKASGKLRELKR